ncbi:23S rRNA (adenine(2503)-C(2))-methyltransferase RlmN [Bythopirellula polymerisocia]|uniref:Probable dual-specificity RNA methyltransferase RlmN n=1 Tax=Bythopirellula polymerisocia TaxID=2528003 RepID=A0A5C6D0B1_9BACT|nr:23S rRNA (adenine(2503)-C(2))-methyltransferase RlmN [Bythopirellula polymerisocia]TWU30300.1 putative dual-specificity RNA methyltransferase RlmN [Bythopirellula polymerisocia]
MTPNPPHLLNALGEPLDAWLKENSLPRFRAAQIKNWLFKRRVSDWDEMTDLPKSLRSQLATDWQLWQSEILRHTQAEDGTEKLLLRLPEGGQIECVLLRDKIRRTICISTQVGCGMGCVFCASGLDGVERNLTTGEILEQMLRLQLLLGPEERLSHIVVMGMGEPLANLDGLLPALAEAHRAEGFDISARRITISTVGLPQQIERLAGEKATYRLAISLHAPNDPLRNQLVPVNDKIGLTAIMAAADSFFAVSGRRLTFEYVLLADLNDAPEHARELGELLAGREALLNVIPYNPVADLPYRTPSADRQQQFRRILEDAGVRVRFRHRKGDKIDAACGQLRRSQLVELG